MRSRRELIRIGASSAAVFGLAARSNGQSSNPTADLVPQPLGSASSRSALAAIDGDRQPIIHLVEAGRSGLFEWRRGDLSREVAHDPQQGIYIAVASEETGSVGAWERRVDGPVKAGWFGVVGDGSTDDTTAMRAALSWMRLCGGGILSLPTGTIVVSNLGNLASANLTIQGQGMQRTILKAKHSGIAFLADAFSDNDAEQPFVDQFNLEDLTLEGNSRTTDILLLQGIARSHFTRVNLREAGATSSKAIHLRCAVTCLFVECYVSVNYQPMAHRPKWGIYADHGRRAGTSTGHTSNCTFINCELNGVEIGVELARADQTNMVGGASQNCKNFGLIVRSASRYNSFHNVAFENLHSRADVVDHGTVSSFEGCYFSEKIEFAGAQCRVRNCYGERFEIKPGAEYTDIANIRFNHWNTGAGGFFNSSPSTRARALYDVDAKKFV